VGILTAGRDLFCGDLLTTQRALLNAIMDDPAAGSPLERLRGMAISRVYPGHGKPFMMEALA
jgi:glyoxylase-like metal-dependent hydrolase (beta-lactamase superfamily II)